jgi:2,3-dihydroxybenzoate-AMP ligase
MLAGCTPWPEEFAARYRALGYWEDRTIAETLSLSIEKYASKTAVVYQDQRITYAELGIFIDRLAYHFLRIGLKPLDRVVVQIPNSPEFVYTYFALVKIGVIPVLALPPHRQLEISHFVERSGAVAYFAQSFFNKFDFAAMAREIQAQQPHLKYVFLNGEAPAPFISIRDLLTESVEVEDVRETLAKYRPDPGEVAIMLLSGGTTALPKLIPRTHNDYVYTSKQAGRISNISEDTVFLVSLPMAHNYNLACPGIQSVLFNGGRVVISPSTDTDTIFSLVEKEKVTITPAAIPLVYNWLNSDIPEKYDFSSLEVIQCGGSKLAPELRKQLREKFNCIHQENFGTGEGLVNLVRLDAPLEIQLHSSGKPISEADEIKIIDDNGNEVPIGTPGELVVRGPYTFKGYYNAPEINAKAFTPDGFYRMGDECRIDNDNYIYCEGRKKDLINRGGEKISCEEIENLILTLPKVKSVSLVAMPDEVYGEKACAFVILKPGETLTFEELTQYLISTNIAKFKLPERLEIVEEFPISPAGKILKRTLREMVTQKLEQEKGKSAI